MKSIAPFHFRCVLSSSPPIKLQMNDHMRQESVKYKKTFQFNGLLKQVRTFHSASIDQSVGRSPIIWRRVSRLSWTQMRQKSKRTIEEIMAGVCEERTELKIGF